MNGTTRAVLCSKSWAVEEDEAKALLAGGMLGLVCELEWSVISAKTDR